MKKKVTALVLCMCLLIAGVSWNASAETVQDPVWGTESIEPIEENIETEAPAETEELETTESLEEYWETEEQEELEEIEEQKESNDADEQEQEEIAGNVGIESGEKTEETVMLASDDTMEQSEEGTYRPYDGATYQLRYRVEGECITITGIEYENSSWNLGQLIIPETIDGKSVTGIGEKAFYGCYGFTGDLVIPEGIIFIGDSAFFDCYNLGSIEIPESVKKIGDYAFYIRGGGGRISVLGNDAVIGDDGLGSGNFIYGYKGSTVESYAKYSGSIFIALDGEDSPEVIEYRVSTTEELLEAINSSQNGACRRIILADGIYETQNPIQLNYQAFLTIEAEHIGKAEILLKNLYMPVVEMGRCLDVNFTGCILGHSSADGSEGSPGCGYEGYVFYANQSYNVKIESCDLYGCGVEGIDASNCENMEVTKCIIRDCMRNVAYAYGVTGINFTDCIMSGNAYNEEEAERYAAFQLYDSQILLKNCTFLNNHSTKLVGTSDDYRSDTSPIKMEDCKFYDNAWDGKEQETYGICLNGITWQVENKVLMIGYPIQLSDGTAIESAKGEVLNYSKSAEPWAKCIFEKVEIAEGVYAQSYINNGQPEIITTTQDLNMEDVVRVKYVPYYYTLKTDNTDEQNQVTFFLAEGKLPEGLHIYPATGEIYGVPLEAGDFPITVKATYSNMDFEPSFANLMITVLDNTDSNVYNASDPGYEIRVPLGKETEAGSNIFEITESGDQLFVSAGEMREFVGLWLNGQKLEESKDYSAVSGSTRITIYGETLENKADSDGTNTIAAEFRIDGNTANGMRRTAQNFRLNIGGGTGNAAATVESGKNTADSGKESQNAVGKTESATAIWQIVDAAGQPHQNITVELHSTPMTAAADQRGIVVFRDVEGGGHKLTVKDRNNAVLANKSFELLFGDGFRIEGDRITVKNGSIFTVTAQVDNGTLTLIRIQEGDVYRVIAPRTDDIVNFGHFALPVLFCGMGAVLCLYGRKKRNRTENSLHIHYL